MKYGSVCSGIEAATMAWHPLGWHPAFFSEIEAFPSAVLAHHYGSNMPGEPLAKNGIPNYGDFTKIGPEAGPVDLLVGGTPCQSFSVAGKRLGLDDPRGNLALEYLSLARRLRARWIVWENVPGVLSSHTDDEQDEEVEGDEGLESADFATFLSFVQECGYGFAYRVLDAQYVRVDEYARAVPQRRRRVFLVGYLGDWRRAAAVLLEPESMRGDSAPRREAGQRAAGTITASLGHRGGAPNDDNPADYLINQAFGGGNTSGPIDVSTALTAHGQRQDFEVETFVAEIAATLPAGGNSTGGERQPGMGAETAATMLVAHALRGEGFDASEDGTGRGTPIVPVPLTLAIRGRDGEPDIEWRQDGTSNAILTPNGGRAGMGVGAIAFAQNTRDEVRLFGGDGKTVGALAAEPGMKQQSYVAHAIQAGALRENPSSGPDGVGVQSGLAYTVEARSEVQAVAFAHQAGGKQTTLGYSDDGSCQTLSAHQTPAIASTWAVRRLTPMECERLQGFPEIRKTVRINIWLDGKSQQFAGAEKQCTTAPNSALIADENASLASAKNAAVNSNKNRHGRDLPVALHARVNYELGAVEIHKAGRCLWSASIADKQSTSPLSMPTDVFAQLIAQITASAEKEAPTGKVASQASMQPSTHPESGSSYVNVSGLEIEQHAASAASGINTQSHPTASTTSDCGPSSPNTEWTMTTSCCSAVAAIASFIPETTSQGNSFSVIVETVQGFTNVPYRGKPAADGPRYKALGNSMAVNCMAWIGRRIDLMEKILSSKEAAE